MSANDQGHTAGQAGNTATFYSRKKSRVLIISGASGRADEQARQETDGGLCRHRVGIVVRNSVVPGLFYEKCQANSTRNPVHEAIRRSRVIPNK